MRTAHQIQILSASNDELVEAEIFDEIDEHNWKHANDVWRPLLKAAKVPRLTREGKKMLGPTEDSHWDWERKVATTRGRLSHRGFAIECAGMTEGLMQLEFTHRSRSDNQHLVYVDFLSVAPWNRSNLGLPRRFRGIGTILLAQAVGTSLEEDFNGRIGLHALPSSASWYRDQLKMTSFGPDEDYDNLEYFEYTEEQAQRLLAN